MTARLTPTVTAKKTRFVAAPIATTETATSSLAPPRSATRPARRRRHDPSTLGLDADGDGYPSTRCCNGPPTALRCGGDCDDSRLGVNFDAPEVCNGADDDCDGSPTKV
ncbi:MAG: putative metal-binding motif-containing protein [Polyangiales bacterium]